MPDTSICITAKDNYSETVKKMTDITHHFSKDAEQMEETLRSLSKQKVKLKIDVYDALADLKDAEKAYLKFQDEASLKKLKEARGNYDLAKFRLDGIGNTARQATKHMTGLKESTKDVFFLFKKYQMFGDATSGIASYAAKSAIGLPQAELFGKAIQNAITGFSLGGAGGATIGAISGFVSGLTTIFTQKDDAFQSYYNDLYNTASQDTESRLSSGSTTASQREKDRIAFSKKLGGDANASAFLQDVQSMASQTAYSYDEITGYAKTLLNGYGADKTLSILGTLSDASAGLNLSSSDVDIWIQGLNRMKLTGKATTEYLNYFSERGLDVYSALADWMNVEKSRVNDLISSGKVSGTQAAEAILAHIQKVYGGLSGLQSSTFDGLTANLEDIWETINAGMGSGYNEARKSGLQASVQAYGGDLGESIQTLYGIIGQNRALRENMQEQYQLEAQYALTNGITPTVYSQADSGKLLAMSAEYNRLLPLAKEGDSSASLRLEKLWEEADALATSAYESSEFYQEIQSVEREQIEAIRANTDATAALTSYLASQELSKGRFASIWEQSKENYAMVFANHDALGYATGIDFVPYDNFPALLHRGEQVLTAEEARSAKSGVNISISMNGTVIREEADVDRIAVALSEKISLAMQRV